LDWLRPSGSSREYVQLTVRLPPKLHELVKRYAQEWGLIMQDAIVYLLLSIFEEVEE